MCVNVYYWDEVVDVVVLVVVIEVVIVVVGVAVLCLFLAFHIRCSHHGRVNATHNQACLDPLLLCAGFCLPFNFI